MRLEMVYADASVSITEVKKNPSATIHQAEGFPVTILHQTKPAAYLVPAAAFEALLDKLEDVELASILKDAKARRTSRSRSMTYRPLFKDEALTAWRKLDDSIREQFKTELRERLAEPRVEAARLSGMRDARTIGRPSKRVSARTALAPFGGDRDLGIMALAGCVAIVVRIRGDPAGVDLLANDVHSDTHTGYIGLKRGRVGGEVTEARTVRLAGAPPAMRHRLPEYVFDQRIRPQPPAHTGPSCGSTFLHRPAHPRPG